MLHTSPDSVLALRADYRQAQSRAARLRLLVESGRTLNALPAAESGALALQRACSFCAMDGGVLLQTQADGGVAVTAGFGPVALQQQLVNLPWQGAAQVLENPLPELPLALCLPLYAASGEVFGALLLGNASSMRCPDEEDLEALQLLATLLAGHLQNSQLMEALSARERSMSELVHRQMTAQEDERARVAYDLHDGLAQTLAGLHQHLQGFAQHRQLNDDLRAALAPILQLAQRSMGETRQAIGGLRPTLLDDFGLAPALDRELDRLRALGRPVQWRRRDTQRLRPAVEIALFRIGQEAINNICKHTDAGAVSLDLHLDGDTAHLLVEDQGQGFVAPAQGASTDGQGIGLVAMRERCLLLDGQFSCNSQPGQGTRLLASIPRARSDEDAT
ncbi:MAG: sensor histidine kinase [Gammaproteobacteria bacterium]|nr:sensor histidine kinase [Gammaproteobacteria bacterium]MBU1488869.1 sensor histidine kinase [Gammaproteobacteria bacterium]MBU2067424.1 sensor histidine kinase [Gammaproteobacteria bacterium]MBU2138859.1 sensor histidine kinase [Gammaproteobacteria bacterium]MBU2216682.1 sensor histidine kinase [Gammaproteobacteria bacterium]